MCNHRSVLADECLAALAPHAGGRYLDGTLGLGGHSLRIFKETDGLACILGIDRDRQALQIASERLSEYGKNFIPFHGCLSEFPKALHLAGWEKLDGVIVDLGVSSLQLDCRPRGFSFLEDGPLDMRMNPESGISAAEAVNNWSYEKLKKIIRQYGEEPLAARIARAIESRRQKSLFRSTLELAECVKQAYPTKRRFASRNHPATKTFQAIRIAVNNELGELEMFLERIVPFLQVGASIAIISFHSLEDRIVKHFFKDESLPCICPRDFPYCRCGRKGRLQLMTKKPIYPSQAEMDENPRSRSAKLRIAKRSEEN